MAEKSTREMAMLFNRKMKQLLADNATLTAENTLLKAQIAAHSDRTEFLEDCIAEMAGAVYQ